MQRPHGGARNFTTPPDPAPNPRHAAARLQGSAVGRETATRTRTAGAVGVSPRARAVFWGRSTSVVASASSPGKRRLAKAEPLGQGRPASRSQSQDWNPGSFDLRRDASVSLSCGGLAPGARERSERRARPCPLDTSSCTAPGGSWNPQPFFLFFFLLPFLFFFFFSGMYITHKQQQTVQILKARLECLPVFRRMSPFPHQDDTSLHQPAPF